MTMTVGERTSSGAAAAFDDVLMRPDVQDALATLLGELPRLASSLTLMGKVCQAASEALSDPDLMGGLEDMVRERAKPWCERARSAQEIVREAQQRAAQDDTRYGVFALLKLFREPAVQRALRFVAALLEVTEEHRRGASERKAVDEPERP
jgi:hypothetical protein